MKSVKKRLLLTAVALSIAAPTSVFATNGYFLIGFGAKSRGMGGVGVAYGQDGMAAAFNPAGMIDVDSRFDIGGELFMPKRAVYHDSVNLPADETSKGDFFLLPSMGGISHVNPDFAWGVAVVGAGLGTKYNQANSGSFFNFSGLGGNKNVGVSLMQMQILPSVAFRLNKTHTFGASLSLATQEFKAWGLGAFGTLGFTNDTSALTDRGMDWAYGFGARLGWLGKFDDNRLTAGLNYSSRVYMTKFNRYAGLFAEGGDFDIPSNYAGGLAFKVTPKFNVTGDMQYIRYSEVRSVGNPGPDASNPSNFFPLCPGTSDVTPCLLGGKFGLGFGWTNQTIYKLGMDYRYSEATTLRVGYNYGKSPVPASQVLFNMLAPGVVEHHITLGATFDGYNALAKYMGAKRGEININYMHAFRNTLKGPTAFPPAGYPVAVGTNASIAMEQNAIGIAYAFKF